MTTTVLVVEDEAKLRDLLRSYFEREGMVVLSTASGSDAIDLGAARPAGPRRPRPRASRRPRGKRRAGPAEVHGRAHSHADGKGVRE